LKFNQHIFIGETGKNHFPNHLPNVSHKGATRGSL
jgi:hypothetical protein